MEPIELIHPGQSVTQCGIFLLTILFVDFNITTESLIHPVTLFFSSCRGGLPLGHPILFYVASMVLLVLFCGIPFHKENFKHNIKTLKRNTSQFLKSYLHNGFYWFYLTTTMLHNTIPTQALGKLVVNSKEFKYFRKKLNKTQNQMAELLASSLKAIHSYEQGWRNIPVHVERQILFLVSQMNHKKIKPCWSIKKCTPRQKKNCPAWEFRSGKFCWLINGTICEGEVKKNWREKINLCRKCEVFNSIFDLPSKFLKTPIPIPLTQS